MQEKGSVMVLREIAMTGGGPLLPLEEYQRWM
jgi:hypothetical protein